MRLPPCVIDATNGERDGLYTFRALGSGQKWVLTQPPESFELVGVVHDDGQEAVERFCREYEKELREMGLKL